MKSSLNGSNLVRSTWLLPAAVWLFPLGWPIFNSFKLSNVASFGQLPCLRSAEWHSAVSQVGNLRGYSGLRTAPKANRCPADCQSAIRQIGNLRYHTATHLASASIR